MQILKILWKSNYPLFHYVARKHGSRKKKNQSWIQEIKQNVSRYSWSDILTYTYKSVHPFCHNVASRHRFPWKYRKKNTVTGGLKTASPDCSVYRARPILKISWKSVHTFFRNIINRQTDRLTDRQTDKPTKMKTLPSPFSRGNNKEKFDGL